MTRELFLPHWIQVFLNNEFQKASQLFSGYAV